MDVSSVTDSTDWLTTPLAGLAPLESSLRCQVCKEILTTPMITSCSHTFCSLCIRRYLSQEGKCPSCRESDQEMKLRHNYAVEELVGLWKESREEIWKVAIERRENGRAEEAGGKEERPKKRRRVGGADKGMAAVVQKSGLEERRSTRSQSRRVGSQSQSQASQLLPPATQEEFADSDASSEFQASPSRFSTKRAPTTPTEPHDGLVGCPNCNRRMRETAINTHLDKCLQGTASPTPPPPPPVAAQSGPPPPSSPDSHIQAGTIAYTQTKPTGTTNQRLPTINYSLLTETALRRKLKDLGIPNQGGKELMRRRHGEWVNLWNANCDSLQPVTKGKLLRDLDTWERNLGRDERLRQATGAVMEKEFDREGYMEKEKDNFADLVRKARESRNLASPAPARENAEAREVGEDNGGGSAQYPTHSTSTEIGRGDMPTQDPGSSNVNHVPADAGGSGSCHDEAPTIAVVAETLVPNTPPRPQTNGYHITSGDGLQKQHRQQQHKAIDVTSPPPSNKAQQGYQQHQQHQPLERSSQISL